LNSEGGGLEGKLPLGKVFPSENLKAKKERSGVPPRADASPFFSEKFLPNKSALHFYLSGGSSAPP